MLRLRGPLFAGVTVLAVAANDGAAQVITGTLEGRVTDSSGGVLPGVTVSATNPATAATSTVATTSEGFYRVPYLPSGTYDVRAELSGFRTETKQGVTVRVNDSVVVDFTLTVAPVSETITVQATPSSVQITRSELKRTYEEATLKEIPIGTADATGRNVYGIATRAPGITTPSVRFGRAFSGPAAATWSPTARRPVRRTTNWTASRTSIRRTTITVRR
jgi:hypothetical protein